MQAWSELSDRKFYRGSSRRGSSRLSGSGVDKAPGSGFAVARSGQERRRRGGGRPAALGLWDELPSGLSV